LDALLTRHLQAVVVQATVSKYKIAPTTVWYIIKRLKCCLWWNRSNNFTAHSLLRLRIWGTDYGHCAVTAT